MHALLTAVGVSFILAAFVLFFLGLGLALAALCVGFGFTLIGMGDMIMPLEKILAALSRDRSPHDSRNKTAVSDEDIDARDRRLSRQAAVEESRHRRR